MPFTAGSPYPHQWTVDCNSRYCSTQPCALPLFWLIHLGARLRSPHLPKYFRLPSALTAIICCLLASNVAVAFRCSDRMVPVELTRSLRHEGKRLASIYERRGGGITEELRGRAFNTTTSATSERMLRENEGMNFCAASSKKTASFSST